MRHGAMRGAAVGWAELFQGRRSFLHLSHTYGVQSRPPAKRWRAYGASAANRPSLDDVEKLSRGKPSKAKIGSRSVPHRLNAEERKAFELAKRRAFVVLRPGARRYPLANTFRNHCLALGWPSVRIEQGLPEAGEQDRLVVDLLTLQLDASPQAGLARDIVSLCAPDNGNPPQTEPAAAAVEQAAAQGSSGAALGRALEEREGVWLALAAGPSAEINDILYGESSGSDSDEGRSADGGGSHGWALGSGATGVEAPSDSEGDDGERSTGLERDDGGESDGSLVDGVEGVLSFRCSRQEAKALARRVLDFCRDQRIAPIPRS